MADLLLENTTADRPTMTRTEITRAWIALYPEDDRPHHRANGGRGGSVAAARIYRALTTLEHHGLITRTHHHTSPDHATVTVSHRPALHTLAHHDHPHHHGWAPS